MNAIDKPIPKPEDKVGPLFGIWFYDDTARSFFFDPFVRGCLGLAHSPAATAFDDVAPYVSEGDRERFRDFFCGEPARHSYADLLFFTLTSPRTRLNCRAERAPANEGGRSLVFGAAWDATAQPHWDQAVLEQQEMYRQILDTINELVLCKGPHSKIVWANRAFREYYGMTNEELYNIIDAPFNEPDFTQQYIRDDHYVFTTGKTLDIPEEPVTRHDGVVRLFHTVKSAIVDLSGKVKLTVGVSRDITEEKRSGEELGRYRQHLEQLVEERTQELSRVTGELQATLDSLSDAVIAADSAGRIQLVNPAAAALTGLSLTEARGARLEEVFKVISERKREPLSPHNRRNGNGWTSGLLLRADGKEQLVSFATSAIGGGEESDQGIVIVFRDISAERELEQEKLRRQKLESVGLLAGGIAHDFNNILSGILGNLSVIGERLSGDDKCRPLLNEAEQACLRARSITRQLLTFSKGGAPVKSTLRLESVVRDAATLALRGSKHNVVFEITPGLAPVDADEGQIAQLISNLILNAAQAMHNAGTVLVQADNVELEGSSAAPLPAGRYIKITVCDTGVGIPPEALSKVWDPYFTTKEKGTGLGLSSVHSIVANHGGHASISSEVGKGTTVSILLPASNGSPAPETQPFAPVHRSERPLRVLVMDDQEFMLNLYASMFSVLGHDPVLCGGSADTIEAFRKSAAGREPFDVVILDMTLPGDISGVEVLAKLKEVNPDVKAIFSSGYVEGDVLARYVEKGAKAVLPKPFTIANLNAAIEAALQ